LNGKKESSSSETDREREPFNNAEAKRRGTGHLRRWKAMFLLNVVKQFLLGVRAGVGNL
jgi:hypothetical protein